MVCSQPPGCGSERLSTTSYRSNLGEKPWIDQQPIEFDRGRAIPLLWVLWPAMQIRSLLLPAMQVPLLESIPYRPFASVPIADLLHMLISKKAGKSLCLMAKHWSPVASRIKPDRYYPVGQYLHPVTGAPRDSTMIAAVDESDASSLKRRRENDGLELEGRFPQLPLSA